MVKKAVFLLLLGMLLLCPCFSQNMLMLGGDYDFIGLEFFGAGPGFNIKLFNDNIQNDFMINFGAKRVERREIVVIENQFGEKQRFLHIYYPLNFFFYFHDKLYYTHEWKYLGLRAGIYASFGIYGIRNFPPTVWDFFFNPGVFAGIVILPKSLISFVVDICPGYALDFSIDKGLGRNYSEFTMSLSIGIRLNLDKL